MHQTRTALSHLQDCLPSHEGRPPVLVFRGIAAPAGIAAGCQRLLPTPTSAEQTSSSQYVWVSPISKYGTPTHSIEIAIGIVLRLTKSTAKPPGTLEMAPTRYWHVMIAPISP